MRKASQFVFATFLLAFVVVASGGQEKQKESAKSMLLGTWRLESRVVRQAGKVVADRDLGESPLGYLMYDSSGHMSVQLMKKNRSTEIECTSAPVPTNNTVSVNGFQAYFGTYTVDEEKHIVTHHLEGALAAIDVGKTLARHFEVSGDTLLLTVPASSPQEREVILHWSRSKSTEQ